LLLRSRRFRQPRRALNDELSLYGVFAFVEDGVFAFVEDEQITEFAETIDIRNYMKLDWMKATAWFKATVTDYELAMTWFTKSGQHKPNFYNNFCRRRSLA
jgi:hypothetical protein